MVTKTAHKLDVKSLHWLLLSLSSVRAGPKYFTRLHSYDSRPFFCLVALKNSKQTNTCSQPTIEQLEKGVKYAQS